MRWTWVAVIVMLAGHFADAQDRLTPRPGVPDPVLPEMPGKRIVVVPDYEPKPSDRLHLVSPTDQVVVAKTKWELDPLIRYSIAGDKTGLSGMIDKGLIAIVKPGTQVLVIDEDEETYKGATYTCYYFRFLDGPYQGQTAWCVEGFIGRLTYAWKTRAELKAERDVNPKARPTTTDAQKAESLLGIAQNLEKSGKAAAALENYREIVAKFPDTPPAKVAGDRIRALTVKK